MTDNLLTTADIADLYKVSYAQARDNIVKTPGFPEPAPGTTWKKPRWLLSDVRQFLNRRPAKTPHSAGKSLKNKAV